MSVQLESQCPLCSEGKLELRQINAFEALWLCKNSTCPYPVGFNTVTVSNLIPELLAPVTMANGGKTTTDKKRTTTNQTSTTVDNRAQRETTVEYSYSTTPSISSYSNRNYSNQPKNFSHCQNNPQLFNYNHHWPSSSTRNGAFSSSLHAAPNHPYTPINAHSVAMATNGVLDSDEPGDLLDELSALFEDNTTAAVTVVAMDTH